MTKFNKGDIIKFNDRRLIIMEIEPSSYEGLNVYVCFCFETQLKHTWFSTDVDSNAVLLA